jgi:hypothetical protein
MKMAFYLISFYGAFGCLAAIWGRAAFEKYRVKHQHQ